MNDAGKLRVGVIGCGHWGPNHIRVFHALERTTVVACADLSEARLRSTASRYPGIQTWTDYRRLLDQSQIDAVVVATPTHTHFEIASAALAAGKHVLVEKPLCRTTEEARQLNEQAGRSKLVLMVGHVFVFNPGIVKLKELSVAGELGRVLYLDAVRTNLGPVRGDVNALYDLGTHDISIFNYLLDARPVAVSALGSCILQTGVEDVVFATLQYPRGVLAHLHTSWLNPQKVRRITAVGDRKMANWDDIDPQDTLRLYDKGLAEPPSYNSFGEFQCLLRSADVRVPAVPRSEPLVLQAAAFRDWVMEGKNCPSGVREGAAVVSILESAMHSLHNGGVLVPIAYGENWNVLKAATRGCEVLSGRIDFREAKGEGDDAKLGECGIQSGVSSIR